MTARLEAIWLKRARRGSMDPADRGELVLEKGLAGNLEQGGRRQVTILEAEVWEAAMARLDGTSAPAARRANLLVRGIRLLESRGRVLRIGGAAIRIEGETRPCERMDEATEGLRAVLEEPWGGGAFGRVVRGGPIAVGDEVGWEADEGGAAG